MVLLRRLYIIVQLQLRITECHQDVKTHKESGRLTANLPGFFYIDAAYALLNNPNIAESIKSVSIPIVCHIHPPNNAIRIVMR